MEPRFRGTLRTAAACLACWETSFSHYTMPPPARWVSSEQTFTGRFGVKFPGRWVPVPWAHTDKVALCPCADSHGHCNIIYETCHDMHLRGECITVSSSSSRYSLSQLVGSSPARLSLLGQGVESSELPPLRDGDTIFNFAEDEHNTALRRRPYRLLALTLCWLSWRICPFVVAGMWFTPFGPYTMPDLVLSPDTFNGTLPTTDAGTPWLPRLSSFLFPALQPRNMLCCCLAQLSKNTSWHSVLLSGSVTATCGNVISPPFATCKLDCTVSGGPGLCVTACRLHSRAHTMPRGALCRNGRAVSPAPFSSLLMAVASTAVPGPLRSGLSLGPHGTVWGGTPWRFLLLLGFFLANIFLATSMPISVSLLHFRRPPSGV